MLDLPIESSQANSAADVRGLDRPHSSQRNERHDRAHSQAEGAQNDRGGDPKADTFIPPAKPDDSTTKP